MTGSNFLSDEQVVHPNHGMGRISRVETIDIAGQQARCLVIEFGRSLLTLRMPEERIEASGLRRPSSADELRAALSIIPGAPVRPRGGWAQCAAEYGQKLKTGDPRLLAEIVRDLNGNHKGWAASIYHEARLRLGEELAVVNDIGLAEAEAIIQCQLAPGPRNEAVQQTESAQPRADGPV